MSLVSKSALAELKSIPISEVAQRLGIKLRNKMALCYNGHDTVPSLLIDDKKGFKCFGCGQHGDSIDLVKNALKLSFLEACEWLIQSFGVFDDHKPNWKVPKQSFFKTEEQKKNLNEANPDIYEWLIAHLNLSKNAEEYLCVRRKFPLSLVKEMEIKSIEHPKEIFKLLLKEWGEQALIQCGLATIDAKEKVRFIWWTSVILFPFIDENFRVNYIQGRNIGVGRAKHINLKAINPQIYNLSILHKLKPKDNLYFCEGISDTLTALAMNYNAIGVLGANNFNKKFTKLFIDYSIYIFPDSDAGGDKFTSNIKQAFNEFGVNVRVQKIPKGYKDLNEFYTNKNS